MATAQSLWCGSIPHHKIDPFDALCMTGRFESNAALPGSEALVSRLIAQRFGLLFRERRKRRERIDKTAD